MLNLIQGISLVFYKDNFIRYYALKVFSCFPFGLIYLQIPSLLNFIPQKKHLFLSQFSSL